MAETDQSGAADAAAVTAADPELTAEQAEAEARIRGFLIDIGVGFSIHRHPPLFTVEDSQNLRGVLPGLHVKNLFLKDKKGALRLVTCLEDRAFKIRDLEKALPAPKMSFGKPELLWEALAVRPGAVTPLALLADRERRQVAFALDADLPDAEVVNCHPLHNRATIALSGAGLMAALAAIGHTPQLIDFGGLAAE